MKGSTYRRCGCRHPETGEKLGQACPKLSQRRHGSWTLRQELPLDSNGRRRTFRRQGYASATDAQSDLDKVRALLAIPDTDDDEGQLRIGDLLADVVARKAPIPDLVETTRKFNRGQAFTSKITVGDWLDTWIMGRKIRDSTIARYARDIRMHLKPAIGEIRLDRLRVIHLSEMFASIVERNAEIIEANTLRRAALDELKQTKGRALKRDLRAAIDLMEPFRRTTGPTTRKHIRATLRAALNDAITQELITFNPAAHVEMDPAKRPKALVWTEARTERFLATGEKPSPVMVWTPDQTGAFLDFIGYEELYALFHLIAFRGLRRGEACGLRWMDVDLRSHTITVATQLTSHDGDVTESAPKSDAGERVVALDAETESVLKAHRAKQAQYRLALGPSWLDTGRVFTLPTGALLNPSWVSDHFDRLVRKSGLPPIRLHDLRHGAATIALAAGTEMKVVQEMLGHSTIVLTADTYSSVLPEVARDAAEAAARLVPRRARTREHTMGTPAA